MNNPPSSVNEWLSSLGLDEYSDKFYNLDYGTMARVLQIWEVELAMVNIYTCIYYMSWYLLIGVMPVKCVEQEIFPSIKFMLPLLASAYILYSETRSFSLGLNLVIKWRKCRKCQTRNRLLWPTTEKTMALELIVFNYRYFIVKILVWFVTKTRAYLLHFHKHILLYFTTRRVVSLLLIQNFKAVTMKQLLGWPSDLTNSDWVRFI